ncbi:MAG TPA: stage II sporulation protein M [Caulobacteraceae bacterium]|nr:stage II sporulation protein M [Caulobacteraceae bacterium]
MKPLQLKSRRFRTEREGDWRRLEGLLARVEGRSASSLTDQELLAIPVLYRATLSSLSVARATSLDHALIDYLESLSTRAYFFVYGTRAGMGQRLARFFVETWPQSVRGLWRETLVSLAITVVAAAVGYLLVANDPSWFVSVAGGMSEGRDPTATTAFLRHTLYDDGGRKGLAAMAAYLFSHNAQIAIFAFALGFAFCLPTAFLLAQNGLMLGAFFAVFVSHGLGFNLGGWIFIHGVTELFAIILGGAAGFRIGWRVAFPGDRARIDAAAEAGRSAAPVIAGVVLMLIVAGLLEGFARQLIQDDIARYAIAASTLVIWTGYFYLPRPARRPS